MKPTLTVRQQRHGMGYAFVGQSLGILLYMVMMRSAFGPLFLKHLGASDRWTLWVLSTPLLLPLVQIPLSLLTRPGRIKALLITGWSLWGLAIAAAAVVPSIVADREVAVPLSVGLVALGLVVNLGANTFWFPLLHDVVPADFRGRFFGRLRGAWGTLLWVAAVSCGLFLGETPEGWRFQTVIFIGLALIAVRSLLVARVPVLRRGSADRERNFRRYLEHLRDTPRLGGFLVYFALLTSSVSFLGAPLVLYMRDLGVFPRDNLILYGCTTVGMVIALLKGGGVMDRMGTDRFFGRVHFAVLAVLLIALGVTFLPEVKQPYALGGVFTLAGAVTALSNLACTAHLFRFVPKQGRVFFLTITNFMLFLGPAFGTFVTGLVLGELGDTRTVTCLGIPVNIFQLLIAAAAAVVLLNTALLRRATAGK